MKSIKREKYKNIETIFPAMTVIVLTSFIVPLKNVRNGVTLLVFMGLALITTNPLFGLYMGTNIIS